MENIEVAAVLSEMADLLEIGEANPFRVRAYRNASRTVKGATRPLALMVSEGEPLTDLPGVGKDIGSHIEELLATGELALLAELREEVPATVAQLLRLDGVGPKRAKVLYRDLGVDSVDALETALDDEKVKDLGGFGPKTVAKIRRSITEFREHRARVKLSDADQLVRPLLAHLRAAPGVEKLEVAGSYRRRSETIGDLDLLAVCENPEPVIEHFTSYGGAVRVEGAGGTKATVVLRNGLQVDLRVVPERSYGAALHYFTGSKEHNVAMRKRAIARGLKLNEYGVMAVADGSRVAGATEEEVFAAVDLPWIDPLLREGRGEIEAAEAGRLPELVTLDDIRGDLQMHSTWSDGKNTIEEMALACRERGYEYLAMTDHSQRVTVAQGLDAARAEEQWKEIDELRERLDGIHVFRSMEVDILRDGSLDLDDEHLDDLDVVVVSVHSYMDLPKAEQTARIVNALGHPAVHILAHPTGRRINKRSPYDVDMEAVLSAAKERHVAVELNASPERLDLCDLHVYRARELGVPVVISTDAHRAANLDQMSYGIEQARRGWLESGDVLNTLPLAEFRAWLEAK